MSGGSKLRVWCYRGDRGNVVVSPTDPHAERQFLAEVAACRTVADVRRLNEATRGELEPAIEMFDEDGWADEDPWDITYMPGYEEGDWPAQDDLGMAELFTNEQVNYLVDHCDAEIIDNMGGHGESLYIPDKHFADVRSLLKEWAFDVQGAASGTATLSTDVSGHRPGCQESHGGHPVTDIRWADDREDSVPTWCPAQSVDIDTALADYSPIRDVQVEGAFEDADWVTHVTLHPVSDDVFLLVIGEIEARAGRRGPLPEGDSFQVIAVRGTPEEVIALLERQLP